MQLKGILFLVTLLLSLVQLSAQDIDLDVDGNVRIGGGTATSNDAKLDVVGNNGSQIVDGISMRSVARFFDEYENGGGFRFLVEPITKNAALLVGRNNTDFMLVTRTDMINYERVRLTNDGHVGIGVKEPERSLHISDVMRLEPRDTAPTDPKEGDMYMDSQSHKLMVYDGTIWQACW